MASHTRMSQLDDKELSLPSQPQLCGAAGITAPANFISQSARRSFRPVDKAGSIVPHQLVGEKELPLLSATRRMLVSSTVFPRTSLRDNRNRRATLPFILPCLICSASNAGCSGSQSSHYPAPPPGTARKHLSDTSEAKR
jgi:hypothetical protein